ncbi:putative sulfate exporter family transporter [Desulfoplanes formicivorans]|nr:putative sulfate exporter family transporter [Desulfoplanes formicivorans]
MNTLSTATYEINRSSFFSALYSLKTVLPGLLAMFFIAIFSNNLVGVPNPFTLQNLFAWLDGVIGPLHHQSFFQIMNSNFVWNPFLMGLVIGNVFGVPDAWKRGLSYIHLMMPLGIIMLAPHFMFGHAAKLGFIPILICVAALFVTATITLYTGKLLKLDDRQTSIVAGGLATGDPHAGVILMPLIKAKGGQVIGASACVILFGIIAMLVLPLVGPLVGIPDKYFGLAAVTTVGNGAQGLFAAFSMSYEAGRYATWFDVGRHVIMPAGFIYVFVVMFIRKLRNKGNNIIYSTGDMKTFPVWLMVFIFCWVLACLHVFRQPAAHAIFNMVQWDFSMAAAALGLSLPLRDIAQNGLRCFAVTCIAGFVRMALLLAVILICVQTGLLPA